MDAADPKTWSPSAWHPDWRDAEQEFKALREFSERILCEIPNATVTLEFIEEGYMLVNLYRSSSKVGVVFANVSDGQPQYQLYVFTDGGEEEYQARWSDDGIQIIRRCF